MVFLCKLEEGVPSGSVECHSSAQQGEEMALDFNPHWTSSPGILRQSMTYGRAGSSLSPRPSERSVLDVQGQCPQFPPDLIPHLLSQAPIHSSLCKRGPAGLLLFIHRSLQAQSGVPRPPPRTFPFPPPLICQLLGSLPSSVLCPTLNPGSSRSGCGYHTSKSRSDNGAIVWLCQPLTFVNKRHYTPVQQQNCLTHNCQNVFIPNSILMLNGDVV